MARLLCLLSPRTDLDHSPSRRLSSQRVWMRSRSVPDAYRAVCCQAHQYHLPAGKAETNSFGIAAYCHFLLSLPNKTSCPMKADISAVPCFGLCYWRRF